jgi:putative ABC transport system substrate-binding protein
MFVAGLAATVGVPRISFAQTGQIPEIVLFYAGPAASAEARAKLIREALNADGLVEGKNYSLSISVAIDNSQLPALAKELVRPGVSAVLAVGPVALRAAQTATATIPIVALDLETDPIKEGFAQSLSHPGGNVTGIFFDFPEYSGKLLELLNEDPDRRALGPDQRCGPGRGRRSGGVCAWHASAGSEGRQSLEA